MEASIHLPEQNIGDLQSTFNPPDTEMPSELPILGNATILGANWGIPHMDKRFDTPVVEFSEVFPKHVAALVRLLTALRREFDGDLDLLLICAVVGDRHFAHRVDPDTPTYQTLGSTPVTDAPSVNAYSVAQFTAIPRETVRRKVAVLVEKGWVSVDSKGNLKPTPKAAQDLSIGTFETIRFLNAVSGSTGHICLE